ncbi:hypothetical protein [Paraburkholderia panacisoli]|uniref:hypothetical protein n=1 Tax=Paraburkholderia panacisoli TaxID=2603818 RepID=UPI001FE91CF8|nr:hypothetical protein [Paraburkholderia panacisoli]
MQQTTRVLHLRLKDRHARALLEQARAVNFLWNYCNELSVRVWERERRFLSGYDFHPFTKGAGKGRAWPSFGHDPGGRRRIRHTQKAGLDGEAALAGVARFAPLAGLDSV